MTCDHPLSWADKRFGCWRCGQRRCGFGVKIKHTAEYRSDLARFANDPEAFVGGKASAQKVIDTRRRRDGWGDPVKTSDLPEPHAPKITHEHREFKALYDKTKYEVLNGRSLDD